MLSLSLAVISSLICTSGSLSYAWEAWHGRAKPNRVTWFLWAFAPFVATVAQLSHSFDWSALVVFSSGLGPLLVFIVSFSNKHAEWKLTRDDYLCGLFSLTGLALWAITQNPLLAIAFSILSDVFAGLPTLIKSYKFPETEDGKAYLLAFIAFIIGFFAIESYSFASTAFIIYLITMNGLLTCFVYRSHLKKLFHDA